jgi:hypothetical protein
MTLAEETRCNREAKPACSECGGKGVLRYFFSEDHTELAPCPRCFPQERQGVEVRRRFYSVNLDR